MLNPKQPADRCAPPASFDHLVGEGPGERGSAQETDETRVALIDRIAFDPSDRGQSLVKSCRSYHNSTPGRLAPVRLLSRRSWRLPAAGLVPLGGSAHAAKHATGLTDPDGLMQIADDRGREL
jgi:hypothetical protein